MFRYLPFILFFFAWSPLIGGQPFTHEVASDAALMINGLTGDILFEKNKDREMYPASITKVATALYVLKKHGTRLEEKLIAKREALASITPQAKRQSNYRSPAYWLETDGTHMGIKVGEEFYLKDLLNAMLIASANDASNVIASGLEGSISSFVENMNVFLKELGCKHTHFLNPHGLHHPQHKTTAYDMALISKEAMALPIFRKIVAQTSYTCPKTNLSEERRLTQTNHLVRPGPHYYKKAIGVKTGYMSQAKKTLVASAQDNNRMLIGVFLGCDSNIDRYKDATTLFDKAFSEKKMSLALLPEGVQKLKAKVPHGKSFLMTYLKEPLAYEFYPSERKNVKAHILWSLPELPIMEHQIVGKSLIINDKGEILKEIPLYALEKVSPTFFYRLFNMKKPVWKWVGSSLLVFLLFKRLRKKKNRRSSNMIG